MKTNGIVQGQILQFFSLFFFSTFVGFFSVQLIGKSQYDSLLVLCIGGAAGYLYGFIAIKLAHRRPNEFIVHYGSEIFPKWIHIFFMAIIFFFCLHACSVILREYEDFMVQTYLPETPNWAIGMMFSIVIAITARLGIVTLFRAAQGLFFITLLALLLNTIFIGKQLKLDRWMAFVTNHSLFGIWEGSYFMIPFFGEVVLIVLIYPFISQKDKLLKSLGWGIALSVFLIVVNIAYLLLLFGPNLTSHLTYPMLEMIRFIRIADFIENLDPLLIAVWSTMVYLKISFFFYISVLIITQLFGLKDHRPLTFSLAAVMVAMSLNIAETASSMVVFFEESWATFAFFVEAIPLLYLLVDSIKRFRKKQSDLI